MKIVVPLDGSNAGFKVIHHAIELASLYGDEVVLLNIQPSLQELGLPTIKKGGHMLQGEGVKYSAKVRIGIPAMEIIAESNDKETRFIAMAVGKGKEEAIGSVSKQVLLLAKCPVLLIPEHAE
ncbi:universal stress protein [Sporosarcina obsidiansis]|uniref:universal stress protein n=1 Tax=Sporosarcina obsidiansis TaxID=2660748 RepID=UPI00129C047B|nr:universal stress protein [Sporosarcina obsidiansis]